MAPLGAEYQGSLHAGVQRAVDRHAFRPTGKRSGAYSHGGAYDVHPYMLMNYNGKYDDVSTLAHELGHTMQSYLSNKTQPFPTADYPIFIAEVASTFNEALLLDHMLQARSRRDDASCPFSATISRSIQCTVFRQTQFAEFELRMHEMAAKRPAAHGRRACGDLLRHHEAVPRTRRRLCVVDDYIRHEWSFIPHFYNEFYVYQYATAFTASEALASQA